AEESAALTRLHAESLAMHQSDPAAAAKLATDPLGPAEAGADIPELAVWTTIANVVMNLDEFVMRN
ncbi:MAG TPA: hypothetical protein DIT64_16410, partial [Verrucomicrobiales bacterium]|nr:hypothetical protein [Verrucomicrobiales bacterium]